MPDNNEVKRQELRTVFQELYNSLRDAIWSEVPIEAKDKLIKLKEDVSTILTTLNRTDIESRTQEFRVLGESIKTVNTKLDELKKEIDKFINNFQLASQIVAKIDKVMDIASKYVI